MLSPEQLVIILGLAGSGVLLSGLLANDRPAIITWAPPAYLIMASAAAVLMLSGVVEGKPDAIARAMPFGLAIVVLNTVGSLVLRWWVVRAKARFLGAPRDARVD